MQQWLVNQAPTQEWIKPCEGTEEIGQHMELGGFPLVSFPSALPLGNPQDQAKVPKVCTGRPISLHHPGCSSKQLGPKA